MNTIKIGYVFFLAIVAAIGGVLYGYDTAVISGTIEQVTEQFNLDVMQQGWYVGCALIGSICGVACAGFLSDYLGRKPAMFISAVLFTMSSIGCALSTTYDALVVFRIIGGVGIGVVSIVAPMYISEVAITEYRGRMVSLYQLAITVGFLVAYFANYLLLNFSQTGNFSNNLLQQIFVSEVWRAMLGMEAVPNLLFLATLFMIPESPRWLIVKHKESTAEKILASIYTVKEDIHRQIEATRSLISSATKSEWRTLFKPGIFKAVIIGVCIAILGQFMGVNAVLYYGPSIFKDAGMDNPLFCQVLVGIVNTVTTVIAMLIIDKVGRKKLIYYGVSGMIVSLVLIAFYFAERDTFNLPVYFMLTFFLFYIFCCAISICAVVFVLLSEMYPNNVRGIAMSIAGLSLWIGTYLIGQLTPWLLTNLQPCGTFILFAFMCIPYMLIMWKLVPETTGKSLEEIERYWTKGK